MLKNADQTLKPFSITARMEFDSSGKPWKVSGTVRDISERKKAEEELNKSQALLSAAIEQSPAGILVADAPDVTIRIANAAALGIRGRDSKSLTNIPANLHPIRWQTYKLDGTPFKPEELPLSQAVLYGKTSNNVDAIIRRSKGDDRWVLANAAPIQNAKGETVAGIVIFSDITERKKAEAQIQKDLKEKEVLLKEIHHRVKNNLQVISSLLGLQSHYIEDNQARVLFKESQNRIRSIALVHEKLYKSEDFTQVDFNEYIKSLVADLFRSIGMISEKIELNIDVEDVGLPIDFAIPCGLIINELVSNSIKYAFPSSFSKQKKLDILFKHIEKGKLQLQVKDNGIGLPEDFDFSKVDSLGLRLVKIISEDQLAGTIKFDLKQGAKFIICFRVPGKK
jgi:two-component sensor histidine kinase/PAS domain-containing protein